MDFDIFLLKGEDLIQPIPMSVNLVLNLKTAIYITLQIGNSSLQVSQLVNPQRGCKVTYIQYWPSTVPSLTFVLLGFDTLTLRGSISHKLFHQLIIFKMIPENIEKLHAIRVREAFTFPLLVILRPSLRNTLWAKPCHKKVSQESFSSTHPKTYAQGPILWENGQTKSMSCCDHPTLWLWGLAPLLIEDLKHFQ